MIDNAAFPSVMAPYMPLPLFPVPEESGKGKIIPGGEIPARLFPYHSNEFLFLFKKRMA
jgi:hypothetical protein